MLFWGFCFAVAPEATRASAPSPPPPRSFAILTYVAVVAVLSLRDESASLVRANG